MFRKKMLSFLTWSIWAHVAAGFFWSLVACMSHLVMQAKLTRYREAIRTRSEANFTPSQVFSLRMRLVTNYPNPVLDWVMS